MGRKPCCEKTGLKKGKWTEEEDEKLINYIKANGNGSWRTLPKNAGLLRCGKSCRLRWINYLREDLKRGNFTQEEEETIVKLHKTLGNRWSMIASHLPGRTDNEIKNYWNSKLSRRVYTFRSIREHPLTNDMIKIVNRSTKQLGRTSRAIAKKYNNTSTNSHSTPSKDLDPLESTSLDGSFSSSISDSLCPEVEAKEFENIFVYFKNILGDEGENIMINDGKDKIIMNSESDTLSEKRDYGDCCINMENENVYAYSSPIISYFNEEKFHWDLDGDGEELINLWTQEEEDINSLPSQSNEINK